MLKEVLIGAAGAGVGYLVARNQLEKKYGRLLDEEIKRTKEFFGANYEGPEDPEFMEQAIKTAEALTEYTGGETKVQPAKLAEEVTASVSKSMDSPETVSVAGVDYEIVETLTPDPAPIPYNKISVIDEEAAAIEKLRPAAPLDPNAKAPYLITFEEFDAEELGYEQITVSFFAGDGIVIDEDDAVITPERVEQTIGTDNLNKFGTNTEDPNMDPNVIYIRCERYNMDFEVTRSAGKHSVEVLGETG